MKKLTILILCFLAFSFINAQKNADHGYEIKNTSKDYGSFMWVESNAMKTKIPVLVFLPDNYSETGAPLQVVYLLHGVNNQPLTEEGVRSMYHPEMKVKEYANEFNIIVVAPQTGLSYYMDSPVKKEHLFATFTGKELPEIIDSKFNTVKNRSGRFLAGFSMGGYGAVSLLCRFPETFSVAVSRGGALNPGYAIEDLYWDDASPELKNILGEYWTNRENYHKNNCMNLINHIRNRNDVSLVLEVGVDDFLYATNKKFRQRLQEINFPHIYAEYPGGHYFDKNTLHSLLTHLQYFRK